MPERHGALIRRATAALAVSVALHVALVLVGGPLPLAWLLGAVPRDGAPVIVEMIGVEARLPALARPPASRPARSAPVALPLVAPPPAEDGSPPIESPPRTNAVSATLEVEAEPPAPTAVAGPSLPVAVEGAGPVALDLPASPPTPETDAARAREDEAPRAEAPLTAAAEAEGFGLGEKAVPVEPAVAVGPSADPAARTSAPEVPVAAEPGRMASEPRVATDPRVDLARLEAVARNPSVSAHAAGAPFVGRREVFEFLLDHPEFAAHVARALRVARYRIWRTEDGLFVDDGWGATGQMFVVRADRSTRVLYARGEFQNKFLPVITGEAVVTIHYVTQPAEDGRDLLVAAISSQLKIDGPFGDLVVKLASAAAMDKAERESRRLVHIFARVLRAVDEKPAALYASLLERPDVPRRELEQFRALLKLP